MNVGRTALVSAELEQMEGPVYTLTSMPNHLTFPPNNIQENKKHRFIGMHNLTTRKSPFHLSPDDEIGGATYKGKRKSG